MCILIGKGNRLKHGSMRVQIFPHAPCKRGEMGNAQHLKCCDRNKTRGKLGDVSGVLKIRVNNKTLKVTATQNVIVIFFLCGGRETSLSFSPFVLVLLIVSNLVDKSI